MFKKESYETPPDKVNTVIGKETFFKGNISGSGLIRVDGEAEGEITNTGDVIIGESGKLSVALKARNITIAGHYEGDLEAEGRLELKKTATALGTFKANLLIVEEGAVLSGSTQMQDKEQSDSSAAGRWAPLKPLEPEQKEKEQQGS